jgi:hypothetical protein
LGGGFLSETWRKKPQSWNWETTFLSNPHFR